MRIVWATVVVVLMGGSARLLVSTAEWCQVGPWEYRAAMSPVGTLLRSPDLAVLSGRPVIVGLSLPVLDSMSLGETFFLGSGDPQEHLSHPDGAFQFIFPHIAVGPSDRLHLVWGEAEQPLLTSLDTALPVLTELWHASYYRGRWSKAVRLYEAPQLYWGRGRGGMFLDPVDGVLTIIFDTFPRNRPGTGPTILVRLSDGALLSTDTVFPAGTPTYMDIAGRADGIHVAFVDWRREHRAVRVQVVASQDAGKIWSAPVVLNPDTEWRSANTWIFAEPAGDLHILWIETLGGLLSGSARLHHARKTSGSAEWEKVGMLDLPGEFGHGAAAMDRCGGLHLVGVVVDRSGLPSLAYFERRHSGWAQADVPVSGVASLEPALEADHSGIYLAWSEVHDGSAGGQAGVKVMVARRLIH